VKAADWIALAGVLVTAGFSTWSAISACKAKRSEKRANQRADDALTAAKNAAKAQLQIGKELKRITDMDAERHRQQTNDRDALEAHPWILEPIPGRDNCWLHNRGPSVKYGITVEGIKIRGGAARLDKLKKNEAKIEPVGPDGRTELLIVRFMHADDSVKVTWHREEDLSDPPLTQVVHVPPRVD
jgi:hypothetical protein